MFGSCSEFPGLNWLANDQDAVMHGIQQMVVGMLANQEEVPGSLATKKFSGHFMVRISPVLNRQSTIEVAKAGVSLTNLRVTNY